MKQCDDRNNHVYEPVQSTGVHAINLSDTSDVFWRVNCGMAIGPLSMLAQMNWNRSQTSSPSSRLTFIGDSTDCVPVTI